MAEEGAQGQQGDAFGGATLRRVEWLTVVIGGLGTAGAAWHWGWRGGAGVALGATISWINFRWLKASVRAFGATATAQAASGNLPEGARPGLPGGAYAKFFGRFALLLGALYVILTRSWLPAMSVLAGLFASAAAVVVGIVYELLWSSARPA